MDSLADHTTINFSGLISVMLSRESWVARYNGIGTSRVPGVYAMAVNQELTLEDDRALHHEEGATETDTSNLQKVKNLGLKRGGALEVIKNIKSENVANGKK